MRPRTGPSSRPRRLLGTSRLRAGRPASGPARLPARLSRLRPHGWGRTGGSPGRSAPRHRRRLAADLRARGGGGPGGSRGRAPLLHRALPPARRGRRRGRPRALHRLLRTGALGLARARRPLRPSPLRPPAGSGGRGPRPVRPRAARPAHRRAGRGHAARSLLRPRRHRRRRARRARAGTAVGGRSRRRLLPPHPGIGPGAPSRRTGAAGGLRRTERPSLPRHRPRSRGDGRALARGGLAVLHPRLAHGPSRPRPRAAAPQPLLRLLPHPRRGAWGRGSARSDGCAAHAGTFHRRRPPLLAARRALLRRCSGPLPRGRTAVAPAGGGAGHRRRHPRAPPRRRLLGLGQAGRIHGRPHEARGADVGAGAARGDGHRRGPRGTTASGGGAPLLLPCAAAVRTGEGMP
ncbi:hypothetical protein HRbin39_00012 [bacterium HR39]|nr:hypothetical protein HRbin39_00012 [bacterium HR39]